MKAENRTKIQFDSLSINESYARGAVAAFLARYDPTVPQLADIKTAVSEAVTNCIVHAYPDRIGPVTLCVAVYPEREVHITVSDQGIGIPAKSLDRIFERFYRVDPARSRETGGSGLGLAITKHCVQENGGRISVWSRTGEGSTFTIELPAAPDEDDDEARSDESTQA